MQVIARSALLSVLCGKFHDPQKEFQEEMTAFANAILEHDKESPFFVHSDHENGMDPVVGWDEFNNVVRKELVPTMDSPNGYYGMDFVSCSHAPEIGIYQCYLGGSPLNSAPGFVISPAGGS